MEPSLEQSFQQFCTEHNLNALAVFARVEESESTNPAHRREISFDFESFLSSQRLVNDVGSNIAQLLSRECVKVHQSVSEFRRQVLTDADLDTAPFIGIFAES